MKLQEFGSFFHFSGDIAQMTVKIILVRKGLSVADFAEFAQNRNESRANYGLQGDSRVDEVNVKWQQRAEEAADSEGPSRQEPRVYSITDGETEPPEDTRGLRDWHRGNPLVDLPQEHFLNRMKVKKKTMYLMANLGDLNSRSPNEQYMICRITQFGDSLLFEPPLTTDGYVLESRHGEYLAKVTVYDDHFSSIYDITSRIKQMHLPNMNEFDISEEEDVLVSFNIEIATASNFQYFDGIFIAYEVLEDKKCPVVSGTSSGRTARCFKNEEGIFNFSHTFDIAVRIRLDQFQSTNCSPNLVIKLVSQDVWGRQWTAGLAQIYLPIQPGSHYMQKSCVRPVSDTPANQLKDFFIGDPLTFDHVKYYAQIQQGKSIRIQVHPTGSLSLKIETIVHGREFMASDTLHHIKYGAMLGRIGLKSDLYWRIMKVLMEFDEARRELLRVRGKTQ